MKKKNIRRFLRGLRAVLITLYLISLDIPVFTQPGMPPEHGGNGNQGGGGWAPLGEGLIFLLLGSALYGIRKMFSGKKISQEHDPDGGGSGQ
jgi:hypothetical protein